MSLTPTQRKGLLRLGDVIIPGDAEMPSFSQAGCADEVHRMVDFLTEADRSSLLAVLTACAVLPKPAIAQIVKMSDDADAYPDPVGAALRMAAVGIKGAIFSLYYSNCGSGADIHELIGWDAHMADDAETPSGTTAQETT